MNFFHKFILIFTLCITSHSLFAVDEPTVTRDVHVIKNATPEQCKPSMNNIAPEEQFVSTTRFGETTNIGGAGVRSCVDCAIDNKSQDCVCKMCYDYFN